MAFTPQIITTALWQSLQELRANKLRTFLSLLGITIGIFCIIAVRTVLDSMENNIRDKVSVLGSDVLYISRRPWTGENGEYRWWEYLQRRPVGIAELSLIRQNIPGLQAAALCYIKRDQTVKWNGAEAKGMSIYGVTESFERMQNFEIAEGRYLTPSELAGSSNAVVIGPEVSEALFNNSSPIGKTVNWLGREYTIVGVTKKSGQNMTGFNFDECLICSYATIGALFDLGSLDWNNDPNILLKAPRGMSADELSEEVTGLLRSFRHVRPGGKNNFSINQLSQITKNITQIFSLINVVGGIIAGLSIIVGMFGVANIMFVTVKERTKYIGLKRAVGATRRSIITEFLLEAIMLCLFGGLVGIIAVLLLAYLLTHAADFPVSLSFKNFFYGISISAFVGLLAGYIPARKASRLDPVVAIRST